MVKRAFAILFAILFVASCSKDDKDIIIEEDPAQITLMYFAGLDLNSPSRQYYNKNISDAKLAVESGALGEYGALYYFLPTTSSDAKLFELKLVNGVCEEREVAVYDDISSLTKDGVMRVIAEVKRAEGAAVMAKARMNLVWSSHGMGWIISDQDSAVRSRSSNIIIRDYGVDEQLYPTRYFGVESIASEGVMNIETLKEAIEESRTHFGYMLFDACLISSVEALYRLRDCSDYIIASPTEVMGSGFPYNTVIPELFEQNGTTFDLGGVCQAYCDFYMTSSHIESATVAVCVTSELEALAQAMSDVTRVKLSATQRNALQIYEGLDVHTFYDLRNYVEVAGADDSDLEAFQTQFDKTFPAEYRVHTPRFYANLGRDGYRTLHSYYGVSTSEPSINTTYNEGWSDESWAIATK